MLWKSVKLVFNVRSPLKYTSVGETGTCSWNMIIGNTSDALYILFKLFFGNSSNTIGNTYISLGSKIILFFPFGNLNKTY